MTTINHKASSFNFSLSANYDNDLAQIYLRDFVSELGDRLMTFGDRGVDYMVILPENASKTDCPYKVTKLNRMKKADLIEECKKYEGCFLSDYNDFTRAEMIDYLLFRDYAEFYQDLFSNNCFGDRDSDFTVYGHCQGEAFEVKLVGKCEEWITSEHLENLYFNQPSHVQFTIADSEDNELVELNLSEFKNQYEFFDKDETLRVFSTALESYDFKNEAIGWLKENLPEYLTI